MKKLIILIIFLFVPLILFAQRPHSGYKIQEKDSSGVNQWDLVTTDKDTSEWKLSNGIITIYYGIRKWNVTSDAPVVTLKFQTTNTSKNFIETEKTLSLTAADSSRWIITESAIGSGMYYRIIAEGEATNDSSRLELFYDGYDVSR